MIALGRISNREVVLVQERNLGWKAGYARGFMSAVYAFAEHGPDAFDSIYRYHKVVWNWGVEGLPEMPSWREMILDGPPAKRFAGGPRCSFCNKGVEGVAHLFAGPPLLARLSTTPKAHICNECVRIAAAALAQGED
jgi:hypothetical protein